MTARGSRSTIPEEAETRILPETPARPLLGVGQGTGLDDPAWADPSAKPQRAIRPIARGKDTHGFRSGSLPRRVTSGSWLGERSCTLYLRILQGEPTAESARQAKLKPSQRRSRWTQFKKYQNIPD